MPPALAGPEQPRGPLTFAVNTYGSFIKFTKTAAHIGFIPLVLYLGFSIDSNQSLLQIFLPI